MLSARRRIAATVCALLVVSGCVWSDAGAAPKSAADYWPFREGNTWTIDTTIGEKKMTQVITVTKVTTKDGKTRAELEYKTEGRAIQLETYEVDANSIQRVSSGPNGANKLTPPLPVVQFPLTAGKKWDWKGEVVTSGGAPIKATAQLTVSGPEVIKTDAGTFSSMRVHLDLELVAEGETIKAPNDYWFASNIGMVKQKASIGGQEIEGLLTSYKLAK